MTDAPSPIGTNSLVVLRYLVSVLVAGSILSIALSTQLNGIVAAAAWPMSVGAAFLIGLPLALFMRHKGWRRLRHVIVMGGLLGFVPWGLSAIPSLPDVLGPVAVGVGGALVAWLALKFQTLPLRFLPPKAIAPMSVALALAALGIGVAATWGVALLIFGPPASPGSTETVAAFEIPLPSEQDRSQFLNLLRHEAEAERLHVDASSKSGLEQTGRAIPEAAATISAAAWRGEKDNRLEASVSDMSHVGFAWITFSRGENSELARRFRERMMRKVVKQWPGTMSLPIMPTGAIPLRADLEATPDGYRLKSSAALIYEPAADLSGVYSSVRYVEKAGDVLGMEVEVITKPQPVAVVAICEGACRGGKTWPVVVTGRQILFSVVEEMKDQDGRPAKPLTMNFIGRLEGDALVVRMPDAPDVPEERLKRVANPTPGQTARISGLGG